MTVSIMTSVISTVLPLPDGCLQARLIRCGLKAIRFHSMPTNRATGATGGVHGYAPSVTAAGLQVPVMHPKGAMITPSLWQVCPTLSPNAPQRSTYLRSSRRNGLLKKAAITTCIVFQISKAGVQAARVLLPTISSTGLPDGWNISVSTVSVATLPSILKKAVGISLKLPVSRLWSTGGTLTVPTNMPRTGTRTSG